MSDALFQKVAPPNIDWTQLECFRDGALFTVKFGGEQIGQFVKQSSNGGEYLITGSSQRCRTTTLAQYFTLGYWLQRQQAERRSGKERRDRSDVGGRRRVDLK